MSARAVLVAAVLTALTAFTALASFAAADEAAPLTEGELAAGAAAAMESGQYDRALELYGRLREQRPDVAAVPYNMGVAAYRQGAFDRAQELFRESLAATGDSGLRSRSAYNLGTSAYAGTLEEQGDPARAMQNLDDATIALEEAIEHFREAIDADPANADAKANAELASGFLRQLEELKQRTQPQDQQQQQSQDQQDQDQEQQDQQQQQQGEQSQDQQQQGQDEQQQQGQDEQQQQGQQSQDQQQQGEQSQDQQQQGEQSQDQRQQGQQGQDEQNQQQGQQAPEAGDEGEKKQDQAPTAGEAAEGDDESKAAPSEAGSDENDGRRRMTREEALRLLQGVRDKERRRREELERQAAAGRGPVEKDW